MYTWSPVHPYSYVTRGMNSVAVYRTRTHGVTIGSGSNQNSFPSMQPPCSHFTSYKKLLLESTVFFLKFYNNTWLHGPAASGASVDPTSQVSPFMLVSPTAAGNQNVRFLGSPQWHNVHTKLQPTPRSGSRVESCGQTTEQTDGQTWAALYALISFSDAARGPRGDWSPPP
jgi:hypothetical protein